MVRIFKFVNCCFVIFMIFLFTGCNSSSGGGSSDKTPASSTSFSPVRAVSVDGGKEVPIYWKYRLMDGEYLSFDQSGIELDFNFNDIIIKINGNKRTVETGGDLSGYAYSYNESFGGDFSLTVTESLGDNFDSTMVLSSETDMSMSLSGGGESLKADFVSQIEFDTACQWFIDNDNLDTFGIGYIYNNSSSGTVNSKVYMSDYGEESFSSYVSNHDQWQIVDYKSSVTVNGKVYNDVFVVERETQVPDISNGYNAMDNITITYWVARGIGMIKGYGYLQILGHSIDIELVETNLVQN
ncbi:MAG: hypothetical protein H6681_02445 [Desulfobacteraceae bacterium]|nr:hypothetical protein [Desulfobacteraceae bacterium]MCB9494286.1 hypothetical protein [Desulfobacteraceae bacterium]